MKKISLTKNQEALVDDDDYEMLINMGKWYASEMGNGSFYAEKKLSNTQMEKMNITRRELGLREINNKHVLMHRVIMNFPDLIVDHKNSNTLDNQKGNLRECSRAQNSQHKKVRKDSASGFKGVYECKNLKNKKWLAYIKVPGEKREKLGYHKTKEEAALAYNEAAKKNFGEYAVLNEVIESQRQPNDNT